jgi:hypothetical protein
MAVTIKGNLEPHKNESTQARALSACLAVDLEDVQNGNSHDDYGHLCRILGISFFPSLSVFVLHCRLLVTLLLG